MSDAESSTTHIYLRVIAFVIALAFCSVFAFCAGAISLRVKNIEDNTRNHESRIYKLEHPPLRKP